MRSRLAPLVAPGLVAALVAWASIADPVPQDVGHASLRIAGTAPPALAGHVWYPSGGSHERLRLATDGIGPRIDPWAAAPVGQGPFPLVLLSHGIFEPTAGQAWLARALAEAGYVVVAIDQAGTDRDGRAAIGRRALDLRRTVDAVLDHSVLGHTIDADAIVAIGHGLGAFTVLTLVGVPAAPERHALLCAHHPEHDDCGLVDEVEPPGDVEGLADRRIRAAAVLEPALIQALDPYGLATLDVPILVVGTDRSHPHRPATSGARALALALPPRQTRYREFEAPADGEAAEAAVAATVRAFLDRVSGGGSNARSASPRSTWRRPAAARGS